MTVRAVISIAAAAALSACGSGGGEGNPVLDLAGRFIPAVNSIPGVDTTRPPAPGFDSATIAANPEGFILVQAQILGEPVLARRIADNGENETWLAQNGFSVSYRDGVMVATRGLGEDLLAASVVGVADALRQGGGTAQRVHDRIGDLNEIVQESFECTIEAQGIESVNLGLRTVDLQKYAEICRGERLQFENNYWLNEGGNIVTSLQFVTTEASYVRRSPL